MIRLWRGGIKNMNDLVSIITPSYNTGCFIEQTIQSVLNQTYKNWEMIIVDDGSNDCTDDVVAKYINDSRIIYIKKERNSGAAISRNIALSLAKGKWIAFLDSDDLWDNRKLELQIDFMVNHDCYFSYTKYREIDSENKVLKKCISGPKFIDKKMMYRYCWPGCLTVMYDSEKIGLIQIEYLKRNNDYAMWLKAIKKSNCLLLDEVLSSYRKRTSSISNQPYHILIKHHYYLFRFGEHMGIFASVILTIQNVFFGIFKKIFY